MAQLLLLSLLVFLFQQSSAQVVVSSSSNKPDPSPPVVPARASPTTTLSAVRLSPAASTPQSGNDGAPGDNAERLAALAGGEGHEDSNGNFGDEQGEKEGIGNLKDEAALPEKGSQIQGNASLTDLENTEEMSQDLETLAFVSPSPVNSGSRSITTTAPSSVNGVDRTLILSTGTTQFPVTVAAVNPAHKQNNATQQTTPFPSTSARSDHTRSLNSTVREEEVTSGLAALRPDEKTGSSNLPVSTVADSLAATQATPGGKQINVQPQGQNQSATDPAIGTKALTTRTPPRVEQAVTSSPLPSSQSPDHQGTENATASSSRNSENSDETSDRSAVKHQPAGDRTTTTTAVTPLRTTINTSNQWTKTEQTTSPSPSPPRKIGERFGEGSIEKNLSVPLEHPPPLAPASTLAPSLGEPCSPGQPTCVSPTASNGTWLLWSDLHGKLSFAWELHVYATAVLFLLLAIGALLGLLLSPGLRCPHRGCLGLANALLLLLGVLRAVHFFTDPYGSREVLPHSGVAALYNLPLAMLIWAQAALALMALRAAGLTLLPPGVQSLPLVAVLAVLHCTVLLAADLMSSALSPAVLVVLQSLSLSWGLGLCLGYLFCAFPHLRQVPQPLPGMEEPASCGEGWRQGERVLGRVLAVCACLGALCCGLHVHATLWLYGLLGNWKRFGWAWWMVQFWARLLELAWAFSLLLLASWVFWRPRGRRGDPRLAEGRVAADLSSSSSSSASVQRHTCWAKIVQSLRGRPCRKSESNGAGGSGAGELPNNWAGQERPGADISKSLIRNRDPPPGLRSVKDSNHGRNQRGRASSGSAGSLVKLHSLGQPPQRSLSSSLERTKEWALEKESVLSLNDFDLRPPSPIDLSRSIDEALHREHLLRGSSLFRPLMPPSPPSPGLRHLSLYSWPRRSSDPQINLSDSSSSLSIRHPGRTESIAPLGSSVPSRQVTAPPTPTHMGCRLAADSSISVPSSVSCPASLRPARTPVPLLTTSGEDTLLSMAAETQVSDAENGAGSRFLEVSRQEDSTSVSSDIIDL